MIIDFDARQGNGPALDFAHDSKAKKIFPDMLNWYF